MDSRRLGGGILIAVSVAIPLLVEMMDLSIPQPVGFAGLAACVAFGLLGVALAFGPQRKPEPTKRELYRVELQRIYADTGAHLDQAFGLKSDDQIEIAMADFRNLTDNSVEWIKENMGLPAHHRFLKPGQFSFSYDWDGEHADDARKSRDNLIDTLKARLANLEALMASNHWDP